MTTRTATCRCGQLQAVCEGEPVRISVCHCLDCKKRSGSAFAAQARWPVAQVTITGTAKTFETRADSGNLFTSRFCPECGSTLAYMLETQPDIIAIAMGAFADPAFPAPAYSVYESRRHAWVEITGEVEHID
ncbi:MAG: GFA family protein [Hyphomonas sp.]|nr:GFA family protein [Hyphomonas sp.]